MPLLALHTLDAPWNGEAAGYAAEQPPRLGLLDCPWVSLRGREIHEDGTDRNHTGRTGHL